MTDFTNLAALVAQGQSLLDLVKGGHITQLEADSAAKLVEVDVALALKIAQANADIAAAIAPADGKIIHSALTKNRRLLVSSGTVPDDVMAPAMATFSILASVSANSASRSGEVLALLSEIEADITEQFADFDIRSTGEYYGDFNVIKIDWDTNGEAPKGDSLVQLSRIVDGLYGSRVLASNELTTQALVKLVSGELENNSMGNNSEVGKWRYCNHKAKSYKKAFGGYVFSYLKPTSQTGTLYIALPSIVTGLVSHPKEIHF
jgi:hypothetical protein